MEKSSCSTLGLRALSSPNLAPSATGYLSCQRRMMPSWSASLPSFSHQEAVGLRQVESKERSSRDSGVRFRTFVSQGCHPRLRREGAPLFSAQMFHAVVEQSPNLYHH